MMEPMMDPQDFENLVMSKLEPGEFRPVVTIDHQEDTLEVLVTNETYRLQAIEGKRSATLYVGRDSGEVVGIRITGISRISPPPDQVHFTVLESDGAVRSYVLKVFKEIREKARRETTTLGIFIGLLEKQLKALSPEEDSVVSCGT